MNTVQGIVIVLVMIISVCGAQANYPSSLNVSIASAFPEGIEYDAFTSSLIFGSAATGTVRTISPAGVVGTLVNDARVIGSFGLEVNTNGNLYFAMCNTSSLFLFGGSYTAGTVQSALVIANASSGAVSNVYNLTAYGDPSKMFANDVTLAADGTVYITDTLGGQIWRVNPSTGNISIYTADPRLRANFTTAYPLSVNGIKYLNGAIYSCVYGSGQIFKIVGSGTPTLTQVLGIIIPGCDGMRVTTRGTLLIANTTTIYELASSDNFATVSVVQSQAIVYRAASTIALVPEQGQYAAYVVDPYVAAAPYPIERTLVIPANVSTSSPASNSNASSSSYPNVSASNLPLSSPGSASTLKSFISFLF